MIFIDLRSKIEQVIFCDEGSQEVLASNIIISYIGQSSKLKLWQTYALVELIFKVFFPIYQPKGLNSFKSHQILNLFKCKSIIAFELIYKRIRMHVKYINFQQPFILPESILENEDI